MRLVLMAAAAAWGACGGAALWTLLTDFRGGAFGDTVLMWPAFILVGLGMRRGAILDYAHGPAFLTVTGIAIIYWIPALVAGELLIFARPRM